MDQRQVGTASWLWARAALTAVALAGMVGTASAAEPCDPAHPCTFQIADPGVQKVPAIFKFQSRISQSKIPVGDATFSKIIVNIRRGTDTLCQEEFTNVRVQDSVLNLEIGRQISCELDEVMAVNPDLYFQVCIGGAENCLKPVQMGTTPYAVKANYAAQTNEAHRADVSAQSHYAHRATADREMFTTNQVGKGYFDFYTPPNGGTVYPDGAAFTLYRDSGFLEWTATNPAGNRLTLSGKDPATDAPRMLTDVQVAATSTTLQGTATVASDLTVGENATVLGNADVTGNASVGGQMDVTGPATVGQTLTVNNTITGTNAVNVGTDLHVTGNATVGNQLTANGTVAAPKSVSLATDPGAVMTVGTLGAGTKGSVVINWPVQFTDSVNIAGAVAYSPTNDSIYTNHIASGQVQTRNLADNAVTTIKVPDSAITSAKIADGAITSAKLASGVVATAALADNAVTTAKIKDGEVGTTDLAGSAVTTAKIATDAVTTAKIATDAVTSAKIADGTITSADLAPGVGVPVGTILDWYCTAAFPSSTGCAIPAGFAKCDGTVIADAASPLNGKTLPNFTNTYAVGGATAGTTSGAAAHVHAVAVPEASTVHNHRWARYYVLMQPTSQYHWDTWDADSNFKPLKIFSVSSGVNAGGQATYHPIGIDRTDSYQDLYTENATEVHTHPQGIAAVQSNVPPSISVIKIMRIK